MYIKYIYNILYIYTPSSPPETRLVVTTPHKSLRLRLGAVEEVADECVLSDVSRRCRIDQHFLSHFQHALGATLRTFSWNFQHGLDATLLFFQ